MTDHEPCTLPPEGWGCTRAAGHDGPCAAEPIATGGTECLSTLGHRGEPIMACDRDGSVPHEHENILHRVRWGTRPPEPPVDAYVALAIQYDADGNSKAERVLAAGTDPDEVIARVGDVTPTRSLLASLGWVVVLDRYARTGTRETVAREQRPGGMLRMR